MPEPNGVLQRAAPLRASSWDAEAWTVEAVLSTGAAVERYDARGVFDEVLSLDQQWPSSIPLLDSHSRNSVDDRLGEVIDIKTVGGELRGTVKLSKHNERAKRVAAELTDSANYGISIGYTVSKWAESKPGGKRVKTAVTLDLLEASLTTVPADKGAGLRSISNMTTESTTTPEQPTQTRAEINTHIRAVAKKTGLDQAWIDSQIDAEPDVATVNAAALEAMTARSASTAVRTSVHVGTDHNDPDQIRSAMSDAIAHRIAPQAVKLEGRATEYRGLSLLDMVGDIAVARGERLNLRDRDALLQRAVGAHSTSDFPLLLADSANKALLAQYEIAAPTYRKFAARKSFNNWDAHSFLRVGDMPGFQEIQEGGEVRYGTMSESGEKVTVREYTTGIALSRRAIAQDDLSALADLSSGFATRAANDENRWVYDMVKANPTMSDGEALFSAAHGNLPTAAAFGADAIGAMVQALRKQTSLDGMTLNLQPAYLVVGVELEVKARQLLAAVNPTKSTDVNPWTSFAELVVDPNLGPTEYYIFASPNSAPAFIYGHMAGMEGPQARAEVEFETLATKVAATLVFGHGAIDYRGAVKNAGQ